MGDVNPSFEPEIIHVAPRWRVRHPSTSYLAGLLDYPASYKKFVQHPSASWVRQARDLLSLSCNFHATSVGSFQHGGNAWFLDDHLDACSTALTDTRRKIPEALFILYELDDPTSFTLDGLTTGPWSLEATGLRCMAEEEEEEEEEEEGGGKFWDIGVALSGGSTTVEIICQVYGEK
ncbi:acetyl-coenzyme A synthetase [Penicillium diatomitis]|uniref:Acetyl-coenzyme A synthetase n=1 Tax=Penicillium diatomitis TaxID=2819901 RepID=A0A9W9XGZ3_9EURO|nr:acetyl-coenzyme A synthetase [Penicillium diatomitis]KAJ5492673.1 acetyl-coenzyme A synthetase [Penicillium diatomitis]